MDPVNKGNIGKESRGLAHCQQSVLEQRKLRAKLPTDMLVSGPKGSPAVTNKMSPEVENAFLPEKVERLLKNVLEEYLKDVKYRSETCSKLTQEVCSAIKKRTKVLNFDRYKLVVSVIVGQDSDQAVQIASRCLWNHAKDNFAAATYRNSSIYAIGIVYGIHLE